MNALAKVIVQLPSPVHGHGFPFGAWLFKQQDRNDAVGVLARELRKRHVTFRWYQRAHSIAFELNVPDSVLCNFSDPGYARYVVGGAWLEFQTTMLLFASSDFFHLALAASSDFDRWGPEFFARYPTWRARTSETGGRGNG